MAEMYARRVSKLVPLLDEVSEAERRSSLPEWVEDGEIVLYVRVPAGKAVYMEGGPRPLSVSFGDVYDVGRQPLSPHKAARARDAVRAGTPAIRHPMIIPGAAYLGLAAKDARLLLDLERVDIHWFPHALQFSPQSGTEASPFTRLIPRQSACCLRLDDGQPKRGPWIGHDSEHALAITLSDVFVEQAALKATLRANVDPLDLRDTSPGAYVLYRAAVRFNDPASGVKDTQAAIQEWVQREAKACGIDDWLFNGEVLQQVRKLINTRHREKRGLGKIAIFKLDALGEDVAALHAAHHWISSRMALLMHAARYWGHIVRSQNRAWASMNPSEKLDLVSQLGESLREWGFTTLGEWRATLLIAACPDDLRSFREEVWTALLKKEAERNSQKTPA